MFVDPCTNLLREINRNIYRVRLATHLVGQLMCVVPLTGSTVAARLATAAFDRNETGSEHRFASGQLLDSAFQHLANVGRVPRNAHGNLRGARSLVSIPAYQKMGQKTPM